MPLYGYEPYGIGYECYCVVNSDGLSCGTQDCDYLDTCIGTTFRDYSDCTQTCSGGSCPSCTCGYTDYPNDYRCVCNAATCASLGKNCGTWDDGCGGTLNCGTAGTTACPADSCASAVTVNDYPSTCANTCVNGVIQTCSCTPSTTTCPTMSCASDYCSDSTTLVDYQGTTCQKTCSGGSCQSCECPTVTSSCGTTACPGDYCLGSTLIDYPSTCTKTCSGGSCQSCTCSYSEIPTGCCSDECTSGQTACDGNYVYTCADYNSDGCLEWGGATACSAGYTCISGSCQPICGNGVINTGETCEYPNSANNNYCPQSTSTCDYTNKKYGTRDSYGNCGILCGCSYDAFVYGSASDANYCNNCNHAGDGICNCGEVYPTDTCTYSVTFNQAGIPAGTAWNVTVNGVNYSSTTSSVTVPGLTGSKNYAYLTPITTGGTRYVCTGCTGTVSGAGSVSKTYTTQYYLTMIAGAGGTVTPSSHWNNSGTVIWINATPNTGYTFLGWTGNGAGSNTTTQRLARITLNAPITEAASFQAMQGLTVETKTDVTNQNLNGVSITVDGVSQSTSSGSTTFTISQGSHSVTAPATVSGRPFSHFWDHDGNADCVLNNLDSSSNPFTFTMAGCARTITALYKVYTNFKNATGTNASIDFNGTAISGFLIREDGNAPHAAVTVNISYFDGSWHNLGTATVPNTTGYFVYPWSCSAGATQIKATFTGNTFYVGSEGTKTISGTETTTRGNCGDGVDNDCDGTADIIDSGCFVCGDSICSGNENTTCQQDCSYPVVFRVTGLPAGTNWGVTVGSSRHTSAGGQNQFSVDMQGMGTYEYDFDSIATTPGGIDYYCSSGCSGATTQAATVEARYVVPTKNKMSFSGMLRYSNGNPAADAAVELKIVNSTIQTINGFGYDGSGKGTTNHSGYFNIVVDQVPFEMTSSDFDMSITVRGDVEAIYECHYSKATRRCS